MSDSLILYNINQCSLKELHISPNNSFLKNISTCLVALCLHDISGDLKEDRLILKAPVEEALDIGTL